MIIRDKDLLLCPITKPARPRLASTVVVAACVVVLLAGCSTSGDVDPNSPGAIVDTLVTFVQDFARQALAAYLL